VTLLEQFFQLVSINFKDATAFIRLPVRLVTTMAHVTLCLVSMAVFAQTASLHHISRAHVRRDLSAHGKLIINLNNPFSQTRMF
jgi:hypothetical protein